MCGIAGIFRVNGVITPADVAAVLKMIEAQVHRGPNEVTKCRVRINV
jgi:asparagine synthetase B (glutamine-hydrolysing)